MEFPFNQGKLCPKGIKRYLQGAHPDRLLHSYQHDPSAPGGFKPLPYQEAIARVASAIERIQSQHGPQGFGVLTGASLTIEKAYLMGKFARVCDYRGHRLVYHGGNIDGFSALVALLPCDRLGIVILTNRDVTQLPSAVAYSLFDQALGLPKKDWNAELGRQEKQRVEQEAAAAKALAERRRPGAKPSRELAAYAGAYDDPAYGTANVSVENGALVLRWNGSTAPLEHFHYDTFSLKGDSPLITETEAPEDRQVFFTLGTDADVASLNFVGRAFKRQGKATAAFEFSPCPQTPQPVRGLDKASCGVLTVPENRQSDNGRTVRLTVVRVPAAVSHTPPLEPILFLAGGPGNSAVLDAYIVTNPDVEVQRDHDVIFMSAR